MYRALEQPNRMDGRRTGMAGGPLVSGCGSAEEVDDDPLFGLGRR
jgi:hypothetical protein